MTAPSSVMIMMKCVEWQWLSFLHMHLRHTYTRLFIKKSTSWQTIFKTKKPAQIYLITQVCFLFIELI